MSKVNPLRNMVLKVQSYPLWLQRFVLTRIFRYTVKLSGTVGQDILGTDLDSVTFRQKNRKKVQNHIGGIHAAGMALLGESATGFIVGVNLPGDKLPLLKSMHVDYTKRASGELIAVASLTQEQMTLMQTAEKGEVNVKVMVTDETGNAPIECKYVWAWIPKK
ncbi:DUF4442 domain-containing protein [Glaciecola sp. HTCC2999]|jgi:acyl-coenzyme A thioesterase PaaI-like protein|uniref:DUF4442 domain-containing protein n=1 Tax=Glaciecola sp. HTCC2999 TaxID=455436 RepID=UPI0000E0EE91|nr:DUF4442 domain-containing protein [Glaciecola sp. HTCC2999]